MKLIIINRVEQFNNKTNMAIINAKVYNLYTKSGDWLGQVVLTADGSFMSITDYGNFSYSWSSTGHDDFRKFIISLDEQYFAGKMVQGLAYIARSRSVEKSAERFASKILPALKMALIEEIKSEAI